MVCQLGQVLRYPELKRTAEDGQEWTATNRKGMPCYITEYYNDDDEISLGFGLLWQ